MMRLLAALAAATGVDAASDGLARRPMRGWNSWNWVGVAGCDDACAAAGMAGRCHSEVVMRQMTDVVAGGKLKELDYEYINLSEGGPAHERSKDGTLRADPEIRYPPYVPQK